MSSAFPFSLTEIQSRLGTGIYDESFITHNDLGLWIQRSGETKQLAVVAMPNHPLLTTFQGVSSELSEGYILLQCPLDHANSRALRQALPWLQPTPLGLTTSAGFGDRLGIATPGHVHALRQVLHAAPQRPIAPIFAQQSIREMTRTHRSPEDVLSDATWGAMQGGWRGPVGADADHLKTPADIDACAAVGFTFYTFDPGAYVDGATDTDDAAAIQAKVAALPWDALEDSAAAMQQRYANDDYRDIFIASGNDATTSQHNGNVTARIDAEHLAKAAAKYGRAVAHVATLYRHLAGKGIPFEVEVSVDETDTPTTWQEHIYIVKEMARLGVQWVSLAPRYIGSFEKGIDYIGDLTALQRDLALHASIARTLGPYKLSLHSGSDKFTVYPLIAQVTQGVMHLKTAGTSYVEALRVVAAVNPALFREIAAFARERYAEDRASYHVSADLARMPDITRVADADLPPLLDEPNTRQVLHVTFGSVLDTYKQPLLTTLTTHEADYDQRLEEHFLRHLEPMVAFDGGR